MGGILEKPILDKHSSFGENEKVIKRLFYFFRCLMESAICKGGELMTKMHTLQHLISCQEFPCLLCLMAMVDPK
jgi:hypothetical protein